MHAVEVPGVFRSR